MKLLNYHHMILSPLKNLWLESSKLEKVTYLIEIFTKLRKFYSYFGIVPLLIVGPIIYFILDFVDINKILTFFVPNLIKDSKVKWWIFWFLTIAIISFIPMFYIICIFLKIQLLNHNIKLLRYMRDANIYDYKKLKKIARRVNFCYAKTSKYPWISQIKKIYLYISLFSLLPPFLKIWIPHHEINKLKQIIISLGE